MGLAFNDLLGNTFIEYFLCQIHLEQTLTKKISSI